jgi:hypothetical protein
MKRFFYTLYAGILATLHHRLGSSYDMWSCYVFTYTFFVLHRVSVSVGYNQFTWHSVEARIAAGTVTCQLRVFFFFIQIMGAQKNIICFQNWQTRVKYLDWDIKNIKYRNVSVQNNK